MAAREHVLKRPKSGTNEGRECRGQLQVSRVLETIATIPLNCLAESGCLIVCLLSRGDSHLIEIGASGLKWSAAEQPIRRPPAAVTRL